MQKRGIEPQNRITEDPVSKGTYKDQVQLLTSHTATLNHESYSIVQMLLEWLEVIITFLGSP